MPNSEESKFIPKNAAWQCATCRKHKAYTLTCEAYQKRIPQEILTGRSTCKEREQEK